jgi:CRP-like cAMP-binding protein
LLLRIDAQARVPLVEISLLRSLPLFRALPMSSLEGLAASLDRVDFQPGATIVREGEVGDRYYAIVHGRVDITQGGQHIAGLGRGDGFGEIALLRDGPRTATATATSATTTFTLSRDAFLTAVNGHAPTRALATQSERDVATQDARRRPPR